MKTLLIATMLLTSTSYAHVTPGSSPGTYHVDQFGAMRPSKEEMGWERGNRQIYEDTQSPKMHRPNSYDNIYKAQY